MVTLERPVAYFKNLTTFATYLPQRKDFVEKCGSRYALKADALLFNGPFTLDKWTQDSFKLKKNKSYYDAKEVKLEEVNYNVVKETATAVNLYERDKLDVVPSIEAEFIDKYAKSEDKLITKEATTSYLEMNEKNPLFKNVKIRQAICKAIDREALTKDVLKNGSTPAGGLIPPSIKSSGKGTFRDQAGAGVTFDAAEAKKLWNEGLKELGMKNPERIELLGDNHSAAKKIVEFLQSQLNKNLGANFVISTLPYKQRLARSKSGEFEVVVSLWGADYNDPNTFMDLFTTGQSFNHGFWSNKEYDALVAKCATNVNLAERDRDFAVAERKLVVEDAAVAPLYYRNKFGIAKTYVKGIVHNIVGAPLDLKWAYIEVKK